MRGLALSLWSFLAACSGRVAGSGPTDASSSAEIGTGSVDTGGSTDDSSLDSSLNEDAGARTTGASADSAPESSSVEAPACSPVLASDYNQACIEDTDCVQVGQVPQCPPTACDGCRTQAVNKADATRFQAALMHAFGTVPPGLEVGCACPCDGVAICRGGKCEAGGCGPSLADSLPDCVDAGGRCSYKANTTCDSMGPPDACAYPDEICCR